MSETQVIQHRVRHGNRATVVFVHGFGGDARTTWGDFPDYLVADPALHGWDIYSLGYPTTLLLPDIAGLWSAEPELVTVADELAARIAMAPLRGYDAIAFIAHSMGGLVVQRAVVDHQDLASRVSHVMLFGTPSFGLAKASPVRFWKRQTRDMVVGSPFITAVRSGWTTLFSSDAHPRFLAVAGTTDEFVPRRSSLDGIPPPGFPKDQQWVVRGNHLEIVKPNAPDHPSVLAASAFLTVGAMHTRPGSSAVESDGRLPWDSAAAAAERTGFQKTVMRLMPSVGTLDDPSLVALALALEALGNADEAIRVLQSQPDRGTDPSGVLAGRLKRRWRLTGSKSDAQAALDTYSQALERSRTNGDDAQVYYHAINVAFMQWAFKNKRDEAARIATVALDACARSPENKWRAATEGEAAIILDEKQAAVTAYAKVRQFEPSPREIDSMYQQACLELDCAGDRVLAEAIRAVFFGEARSTA